jgi:hypothetical protein
MGNSEGLSSASTAASDRPSDAGSPQIEPAISSLSRRENNCVSVANSTATSCLSVIGSNQSSGSFASSTTNNGMFDIGSKKTRPLANVTVSDNVSDRGNNQSGSLNNAKGDGLSGGGSSHIVPPPLIDIPSLVPLQGVNQQSNRLTEKMSACDAGNHIMSTVAQDCISGAISTPSKEGQNTVIDNGLVESDSTSEASPVQNPQLEAHSNITISSVSQIVTHGIQHSSQQRLLSGTVTAQPVLTNITPVVAVQADENQDNVPGVFRQENEMSSARHCMQKTLNLHGCELLTTHDAHIAADSEPLKKTVPGDESTYDTLGTGNNDDVTLGTYQKKTSNANSRNGSDKVEDFGHVQVGPGVGGVEDAHVVENVVGMQDKCVESGISQKCSPSPSYLSDPGSGVGSDVAGEDGNSSSAKVMSRPLEKREVTILADCVDDPMSTAESYQLSASLSNISPDVPKEATGSEKREYELEPEIEVVSCILVLSHLLVARLFPISELSVVY